MHLPGRVWLFGVARRGEPSIHFVHAGVSVDLGVIVDFSYYVGSQSSELRPAGPTVRSQTPLEVTASVAHGTANAPLHDTDCGVVLDRRKFWDYGPDGGNLPPRPMMESFRGWILPRLRRQYPQVTCEITKRALLFEFHETLKFDGDLRTRPQRRSHRLAGAPRRSRPLDSQHRAPRLGPLASTAPHRAVRQHRA
jgi:hypothetical protein